MAETRLREDCWTWLTFVVRMKLRRQKHAVVSRGQRRRMCKEHWLKLWTYKIVVRYLEAT